MPDEGHVSMLTSDTSPGFFIVRQSNVPLRLQVQLHAELVLVGRVGLDADDCDIVLARDVIRRRALRGLVDNRDVLEDFAFLQGHKDAGRPHLAVFGPFGELISTETERKNRKS